MEIKKESDNMKTVLERFKSPVVWCQLVVLIAEILKLIGVYEMPTETISTIQDIITIAFQVFAGINNPADKDNF
jgi:uncharacterized membrane protein